MSIVVDGERSKARLPMGRRLLSQVIDLGLIAKTLVLDGFFIKAVDFGKGLSKIIITAPMGAVVAFSDETGIYTQTADFWRGGFSAKKKFQKFKTMPDGYSELSTWGSFPIETEEYTPYPPAYYPFTAPSYLARRAPPAIIPLASEVIFTAVSGHVSAKTIYDARAGIFSVAGKAANLVGSIGEYTVSLDVARLTQILNTQAVWQTVSYNTAYFVAYPATPAACCVHVSIQKDTPDKVVSTLAYKNSGVSGGMYLEYAYRTCSETFNALPAWLLSEFNTRQWGPLGTFGVTPGGNYSWGNLAAPNQILSYVMGGTLLLSGGTAGAFDGHESDVGVAFGFVALIDGQKAAHSAASMMALLAELFPNAAIPGDYEAGREAFRCLFPYPNVLNAGEVPDSTMFHSPTAAYTWARRFTRVALGAGEATAVKWSLAGLEKVVIKLPQVVLDTPGVRPDITYAGDGLYCCVCCNYYTVDGVSVGSPFTGWSTVALPQPAGAETLRVRYIRPVKVTASDVWLIGVISVIIDAVETTYFVSYRSGSWTRGGALDMAGEKGTWDCVVFSGEGEAMTKYPTYPPLLRTSIPDTPYTRYAEDRPWLY